ncbi:Para-nitrobenzyl esterase [Cytospora mali]|uniref:Carboxylic ester hydrolase n=1 Tax=Cytospora mali TaxID=578113 RepID=A0A194V4A4_CYTMA|nr:Para-nitrobenzyl esterase [Valsa mali var. pyri (nom. inval.)]
MAPNTITTSFGGRIGEVGGGDTVIIAKPMPAESRQKLMALVFHPTSCIVSTALICIFVLLIFYKIVVSPRGYHSLIPIGTRRRSHSLQKNQLLDAEDNTAASPEIKAVISSSDGLLSTETRDIAYNDADDDYHFYCSLFNMAKKQDKREHNPLRPRARTPTPHSGPSATISLQQGHYTGVLLPASPLLPRAVEAWRGIPYAQSTGGANRFRPPVPLAGTPLPGAGEALFRADSFGPICPGTAARIPGMLDGEDCLNLNVYRPASYDSARDALMPVVIYVHGGAFNGGMGTERDMASFVGWSETPILGVNFNYRVGALGFPSSTVAEEEGVLNLGLRDQKLLFEWVRDNVAQFGGDRDRVTLIGLSAGAHSVGYHLQSYSASTASPAPFHRAIMESGGATARATLSPSHPRTEGQFREFLIGCGIQPDQTPADQIFPILRALPLETILAASSFVFARYQDPGTVFTSPQIDTNDDFLARFCTMIPGLDAADLQQLVSLYPDPVANPTSPHARVPPGFGRQWARYEAAYAHYADDPPPVWIYHFAALARPDLGGKANHCDEAAVVAHDMAAIGAFPGLVRTSEAMHGAWTRPFVGDTATSPGQLRRKGGAEMEGCGRVMMFGLGNDERLGDAGHRTPGWPATVVRLTEAELERCKFWWERVELSEGMGRRLDGSGGGGLSKARL